MTIAFLGLLGLVLVGCLGRGAAPRSAPTLPGSASSARRLQPEPSQCEPVSLRALTVALGIVVGSSALWSRLIEYLAAIQQPMRTWFSALPLVAVDDHAPLYNHAGSWWIAQSIAVLQTLGLCALFVVLRDRRLDRRGWAALGAAFAAMVAIALSSKAMSSFDIYAYAGDAHLGFAHGYAPPPHAFAGDWAFVNRIYGTPIVPSAYGPVWLAIAIAATHAAASLAGALFALRLVGVLAMVVCIASLARLGVRPSVLALFALNPALFASYVQDGHNDLTAVAFVLAATAIRPRSATLAIVLAACAGAVKLPFVAIAALAFVAEAQWRRRVLFGATAALGAVAISIAFGGSGYVSALQATAREYAATLADPTTNALRYVLASAALAGVVLALTGRRFVPTLSWAFVSLAISLFGWYLAWGIPYAAAERRWFAAYLISLPQLTYAMLTIFADSPPKVLAYDLTFLLAPALAYLVLRRKHSAFVQSYGA